MIQLSPWFITLSLTRKKCVAFVEHIKCLASIFIRSPELMGSSFDRHQYAFSKKYSMSLKSVDQL